MLILLALFDALSMHSDICIIAYHLATLDARCVKLKDKVEAEPEDDARVDQSRRRKDRLECMLGLG